MSLKGKIALVTGSGTGIGLMIATGFANKGAKVYITGRRADVLKKAVDSYNGPGKLVPLPMDVTQQEDIESAARRVSEEDGKLDILVNNAGIATPLNEPKYSETKLDLLAKGKTVYHLESFQGFHDVLKVNTFAPYFLIVAFIDLLTKGAQLRNSREGDETSCVINISSAATVLKIAPTANSVSYALSKAALELLTVQLAASFAKDKIPIRVNAISPGVFKNQHATDEVWEKLKTIPPPGLIEPVPLLRLGLAEEVQQTAIHFATNTYVNATNVLLDGGATLLNP